VEDLENVEKYLKEITVYRWRQKAVNSDEWAYVIKEARTLGGPYSQGVSTRMYVIFVERIAYLKVRFEQNYIMCTPT
jgi:hypothetical protein